MNDSTRTPRGLLAATLLLILLVAAGLRLYRLPDLPLGFHYDEAANAILAGEIASGVKLPVFIPSYTGKEVLFFYWAALWMKLLGTTPWVLRLGAALAGAMTVAAAYWATRELLYEHCDSKWMALLTSALLATSFWHLILSRYGFRAVAQPLMQALTVAALWRGLRLDKKGLPWLLLGGISCGLTAYTYLAARAFPIPLAAAFLTLLLIERERRRTRLGQMALFVSVAALTLAPLAHYWWTHPGSFMVRTGQVAATGWNEAWDGILDCLGMLFIKGDPYIRFNIPFRPIFDPVLAVLFVLGIGAVIVSGKWQVANDTSADRRLLAARIFLLVSLVTMVLPSALAAGEITPSNLRAAGLLPFVYVFPALGLSALQSLVSNLWDRRVSDWQPKVAPNQQVKLFFVRYLPFAICYLLFAVLTLATALAYFGDWAISPALYYAADGDLADAAAYLNRADLTTTTAYVASVHYDHPTLALFAETYGDIHRLTGGHTVVFPAKGDALLVYPRSASDDLPWVESVLPDDALIEAPLGPDGAPAFHVYQAGADATPTPTHLLDANFSHVVQLLGYDVIEQPRSGGGVEVTTWWRVLNAPDSDDYRPIARLADPWGNVWGETLPFHYISKEWEPGELVADHLSIPVTPGAPPGDYAVRFGFYSANADRRLAVLDEAGRYSGTYVELPVRLRRAEAVDAGDLDIRERLNARIDGLTLLGANLDTQTVRPGEPLFLTLFWRVEETGIPDRDVVLTLGDATLHAGAPVHGTYPFSAWAAGETIADRYGPRLPRDMSVGEYRLKLQVGSQVIDLGPIAVQATERVFDVPPIPHPLNVNLGDQVELLGYDLPTDVVAPGDTLTLALYWRALREIDESYTVFTHLVAADGTIVGQKDNPPVGGSYPTNLWLSGEVIVDVYEIPVRADAVPGELELEVGLYIAESGVRLPIFNDFTDAIILQSVTVER